MNRHQKYQQFLALCVIFFLACGKKKDPGALYYFPNADTTYVGVKNGRGEIIIPAIHPALNNADINFFFFGQVAKNHKPRIFYTRKDSLIPEAHYDFEKPITGPVIRFFGLSKGSKADMEGPRIPAGEVYTRKGKFLYYLAGYTSQQYTGYYIIVPQAFSEGYGLYVEKGKLGYVDGLGNKITPALWEYAEPFNYSYAKVYNGNWEQVPVDGRVDYHALTDTSHSAYINIKGETVKPYKIAKSDKDYRVLFQNGYLPHPFSYTAKEQQLLDSLSRIKAMAYTNIVDILDVENKKENLHFEITLQPKPGFPYYYVQGYWKTLGDATYTFLIQEHTGEIYHYGPQFFINEEKTPFAKWMANGLQEVNDRWSEEMPGVKLKIDLSKELRYWKAKAAKN